MPMTPRERWLALLAGGESDRIVTDYWATDEFHTRFKRELDCPDDESLWQELAIDRPCNVCPEPRSRHHPDDPQADDWGIRRRRVDYGTGIYDEAVYHPLARAQTVGEVHAFRWPRPEDLDYSPITRAIDENAGRRVVMAWHYEPFLLYGQLRGLEQAFMDLVLNPDVAEAILGRLFEFYYERNRRMLEIGRGRIDLFVLAEDLGSQTGPLISLDHYRRFLLPNQVRMANLARSFGCHIFYHTDGASRPFLSDLIDKVGIEILNPIQWRCPGMEREGLVRDFGKAVVFHGAMDNQYTLPFGTVAEVAAEVRENRAIFGRGRWICAPCHNIQSISPTVNIVTLFRTAQEESNR
ncbi:MAG: uroporphyrinogen-III decarboxylase-like protein [Phycisphaerae bacterium]|nr:uroporphyrinogen-III decarboxylase-like protein [Phycisphaerae bacterium]